MIEYKQVDTTFFPQYDQVQQRFCCSSYYRIEKHNRGLGGFTFVETLVAEPYIRDFCTGRYATVERWKRWDLSNWAFFMAFDGDKPIGAAAVASKTEGANLLYGRNDLAALWDIRVNDAYKGQGVGQKLFNMAVEWSRNQGLTQMSIECQNNNIVACKFYHRQGAVLSVINEYAYYNEPEYRHEVQFIWYLDLVNVNVQG